MANSNLLGENPVYVTAPAGDVHRPETKRYTVGGSIANRLQAREPWPQVSERCAPVIPVSTSAGLGDVWIAEPKTERGYIRIDVSAGNLRSIGADSNLLRILCCETLERRSLCANVETGYSVYCGATEDRLTVTLFEVSLAAAFGFFASLRHSLRAAGADVDCARFYFAGADGAERSHCAKRLAPNRLTVAAGLGLVLATETQADYGKTEVYRSGDFRTSNR